MPRRKGKSLTREEVLQAALKCLREEGFEALGINRVARELGIKPPSMYNHVKGNVDLSRLIALEGWRLLDLQLKQLATHEPRERLRQLASLFRSFAQQHQALYQVMSRTRLSPDDPEFTQTSDSILGDFAQIFSALGVPKEQLLHATRAFRSALHGFVLLELEQQFQLSEDVEESFTWLISRFL